MLKKSAVIITSLMIGFNMGQADDAVKKPAAEEVKKPAEKDKPEAASTTKYSIPTKKIEEFTKDDLRNAIAYYQGVKIAEQITTEKDIDGKAFIQGIQERIKTATLVVDPIEWQKLITQYQDIKKANGEISAELKTSLSKNHGINFANKFAQNSFDLNIFLFGYNEKLANKDLVVPEDKMKEIGEKFQAVFSEEAKSEGKKYLEENKKKEGVTTLPSGLQYKIIKKGEGACGTDGQTVKVHYAGTTIDGKEFDSSIKRGQPFDVVLPGQVIKGWQEALKIMPKGSKWQVFIPEDLAYGPQSPSPDIKPYSTLIFEMEVLEIVAGAAVPPAPLK